MDFGSLSDEDLSQMLKDYGIEVGPINVATRSTYERKLFKLKNGEAQPPQAHSYDPVDDEEDNEIELRLPATSTPSGRAGASSIISPSAMERKKNKSKSRSPVPTSAFSPVQTQVRSRREVLDHSAIPRVESRPNLSASRRVTKEATPSANVSKTTVGDTESKGIPVWVKLVVLLVMIMLSYLIYSNMEQTATSNIPHLPNKVEV